MENQKWLLGLICAASLISGSAMSFEIARGAAQRAASQQPPITTTMEREKPSYYAPSECKPESQEFDLSIKQYYFEHTSEFAPLPHSPRERAKALREIEAAIRLKLNTAQPAS